VTGQFLRVAGGVGQAQILPDTFVVPALDQRAEQPHVRQPEERSITGWADQHE
jgi:hypothetical protein